jgi:hypothetical protein
MKTLLHVGCGSQDKSSCLGFNNNNWNEIRLDINVDVNPDIVGTLTDMNAVESNSVDAIYSAHNIEHIYFHEVPIALNEFHRVLRDDGMVVLTCPDLQSISKVIADDKLLSPLYNSSDGPISPIDSLYGWRDPISEGNTYMAHKCGFTYSLLDKVFFQAGFKTRIGGNRPDAWDLFIVAFKQEKSDEELKKIALPFIPKPQFSA